jgi:hypothetical protein
MSPPPSVQSKVVAFFEKRAPSLLGLCRLVRLIRKRESYLNRTGFLKSLGMGAPVDKDGNTLLWMSYPVIDLLESRLQATHNVFEYGSGFSTLFFSKRAASVTSVEHDEMWFEKVRSLSSNVPNVHLIHSALDENYPRAILTTGGRYDLVLIDGRMRRRCALLATNQLTPGGVILWDDSDREVYQEGVRTLVAGGFKELRIRGLKPCGFGIECTSIFYREGNCLGI